VCRDPDDDRVLECALAAGAKVIVSGDRDLLDLGAFRGTPITSPRLFLDSGLWKR
jgi:predicted nucleic acid-binding protein